MQLNTVKIFSLVCWLLKFLLFPQLLSHSFFFTVTHQPLKQLSYVAWDNGADDTWSPAACNTYVKVDLSLWW